MSNGKNESVDAFRIAIRREGEFVNVYFARANTMEGAYLVGSVHARVVDADPKFGEAFKRIWQEHLERAVRAKFGKDASVFSRKAPEHERAGHG